MRADKTVLAPCSWVVLQLVAKIHPRVPRLLPYRSRRLGKRGVGKSAHCDSDPTRPEIGLPIHGRAAIRAEVHVHLAPLLAVANIYLAGALGAEMLLGEKGDDPERRAGAPLALRAVTGTYHGRFSFASCFLVIGLSLEAPGIALAIGLGVLAAVMTSVLVLWTDRVVAQANVRRSTQAMRITDVR